MHATRKTVPAASFPILSAAGAVVSIGVGVPFPDPAAIARAGTRTDETNTAT